MEEIQNTMRDNQYKLNNLGKRRAMEKQLRHPQLMDSNLLEPSTDATIKGKGGGDAGLARVVGSGRRRTRKATGGAAETPRMLAKQLLQQLRTVHGGAYVDEFRGGMNSDSDEECEGGAKLHGGFWGLLASLAAPLIGKLFGSGDITETAHNELMDFVDKQKGIEQGNGKLQGGFWGVLASLAAPLIGKLFGSGQMTKSAHTKLTKLFSGKGAMLGRPGHGVYKGAAAPMSSPPQGLEVTHAMMSPVRAGLAGQANGGQDVPPGGIAPRAYGSAPQAPASFARNSVMLGAQPVLPSAQVGTGRRGRPRKVKGGMDLAPEGYVLTRDPSIQARKVVPVKPEVKRTRYGSPPREQTIVTASFADSPPKVPKKGIRAPASPPREQMIKPKSSPPKVPKKGIKGGRVAPAGAGKKSSVRGQMISKIMKEKGMTLGQASKYLKENGSA